MGIDGETLSHSQGALVSMLARRSNDKRGDHERKAEEKTGGNDNHDRRSYIDGPIARILQSTAPAKYSVTGEILVVFA